MPCRRSAGKGRRIMSEGRTPASGPDLEGDPLTALDPIVAHPARVYDYWLGGKDNFAVDREAAEHVIAANPTVLPGVRANRAFLGRAVRYLAEAGIRQFLDLGTGLPTAQNAHQVAQSVAPDARIVYVDNDPMVLAYARALLTSSPQGATVYVDADIRDTGTILAAAAQTLDFTKPVAVMALMVLQYIPDADDPWAIVGRMLEPLAAGSYLTASDTVRDIDTARVTEGTARLNARMGPTQLTLRTRPDFERFFSGLEMVEPGVVPLPQWRGPGSEHPIPCYAGMGRKPATS
jgi:O-methyltransferase involved in polyketide biosynthesis